MGKEKGKQSLKINREVKELKSVLAVIKGSNPIEWLPIIKMVAPFIARIAIRSVLRRMNKTTSDTNIEGAVDLVRGVLDRIGSEKLPKKK